MQSMAFIMRHANMIKVIVLEASQCGCMLNALDCTYSKLPPEDE